MFTVLNTVGCISKLPFLLMITPPLVDSISELTLIPLSAYKGNNSSKSSTWINVWSEKVLFFSATIKTFSSSALDCEMVKIKRATLFDFLNRQVSSGFL